MQHLIILYSDETWHSLINIEKSDGCSQLILREPDDFEFVYKPQFFLSFFKIFFRAWENAARLFFNFSDVKFATLVKFCFVGFYTSLAFLLKPFTYPTFASIEINSRFMLLAKCI